MAVIILFTNKIHTMHRILLFAAAILLFSSCKKDKPGMGGNVSLILKPQHHGKPIYNQTDYRDSVFIKFGQAEFPGDNASLYDYIKAGVPGDDFVRVDGLKKGQYYIFMAGLDTSIMQRAAGGIPYKITQDAGEIQLIVPITEVH